MLNEIMAYASVTLSFAVATAEQMLPELRDSVSGLHALTLVWAPMAIGVASLLVAGVFQSFSDFVMRGLIFAEPVGGAQSMQMINRTVMRSVFIILLLGLAPVMLIFSVLFGAGAGTARYWEHYGRVWTRWNHVRTIGSFLAGLAFIIAALDLAGQ